MLQVLSKYLWNERMSEQSSNHCVEMGIYMPLAYVKTFQKVCGHWHNCKEISVHMCTFSFITSPFPTILHPARRKSHFWILIVMHCPPRMKTSRPQNKVKIQNMVLMLRKWLTLIWPDKSCSVLYFQQHWRWMSSNCQWIIKNNIDKPHYDFCHITRRKLKELSDITVTKLLFSSAYL